MSAAITISFQQCITELDEQRIYQVPVLKGAPQWLVSERHLREKYHTNRDIKTWSCYFLLKAITTSGHISTWRAQKGFLCKWLQVGVRTFYRQLEQLSAQGLATVDDALNITLVSYRKAADIMGLFFDGLTYIPYNPIINAGRQVFQYILRTEEVRSNQQKQLDALIYYLGNNPALRFSVLRALIHMGADQQRLMKDKKYLQECLLKLQMASFRHGSETLATVFAHRADVNRGVRGVQGHHNYKCKTSVSYMKRRLKELKLVAIEKVQVKSKVRSRIYIPDAQAPGGRRDGYRWLKQQLATAWTLTDQISIKYEPIKSAERLRLQKAA